MVWQLPALNSAEARLSIFKSIINLWLMCILIALPRCMATPIRAKDLMPYLSDYPPTIQVQHHLCNVFRVIEKPYYVLFGSCWVCAVVQQLVDVSRHYEERLEELGKIQKGYVAVQLCTLIGETVDLFTRIDWIDGETLWNMYNIYTYIFVHSSVFIRSVMMSMIVWDWYETKLLKRPIFGSEYDGKGYADWMRVLILVVILQFGSSLFIMGIITVTHLLPALVLYYWVFLLAAGFIIKIRAWLKSCGIDPDGRLGRGLVMASNSFVASSGLQMLITAMIRVYSGQLHRFGYMAPIKSDIHSRHLSTFYECHLSQGWGAFHDQDFLNLFVR